jgi:hypothetical protein
MFNIHEVAYEGDYKGDNEGVSKYVYKDRPSMKPMICQSYTISIMMFVQCSVYCTKKALFFSTLF